MVGDAIPGDPEAFGDLDLRDAWLVAQEGQDPASCRHISILGSNDRIWVVSVSTTASPPNPSVSLR